jgi:ribosomal protein S15P/S13E
METMAKQQQQQQQGSIDSFIPLPWLSVIVLDSDFLILTFKIRDLEIHFEKYPNTSNKENIKNPR